LSFRVKGGKTEFTTTTGVINNLTINPRNKDANHVSGVYGIVVPNNVLIHIQTPSGAINMDNHIKIDASFTKLLKDYEVPWREAAGHRWFQRLGPCHHAEE